MWILDLIDLRFLFHDEVIVHVLVNFTDVKVNLIIEKELYAVCENDGQVIMDANLFEGS